MDNTGWTLNLTAGPHDRRNCPICINLPERFPEWKSVCLTSPESGLCLQAQIVDHTLWAILPFVPQGSISRWRVTEALSITADPAARSFLAGKASVDVSLGDKPFFSYDATGQVSRPFFHPILAPEGLPVTRGFGAEEVRDHVHHRSMWVSHGDVNGTNNWSDEPGHGRTICQEIRGVFSGPCVAGFDTASVWVSPEQEDLLTEQLTVKAFVSADVFRLMDVTVRLQALTKPVTFGDTKEGGILSVRVRPSMEVKQGGIITNAHGGTQEKETWGKRAVWCDYTGVSSGKTAGICLMDHPDNLRHPTYWHVRDYGLMTANPFGISHFKGDSSQRGDWVLPAGEEVVFRYRALVHLGSPRDVGLSDRYYDWVSPMQSTWEHGDGPQ